jgi:hypothetical protein
MGISSNQYMRCESAHSQHAVTIAKEIPSMRLDHPAYTKPELLALAPNQVWSWGITKVFTTSATLVAHLDYGGQAGELVLQGCSAACRNTSFSCGVPMLTRMQPSSPK